MSIRNRGPQTDGRNLLQSSIPFSKSTVLRANGLLLSGVVTATYVLDDTAHPFANDGEVSITDPTEVFCDVLIYSNVPGLRMRFLPAVRVSQPRGGMHDGEVWKPRATSYDITEQAAFNTDASGNPKAINPANLDGDHVIVGFLNDSLDEPIILRAMSHPSLDEGGEDNQLGFRKRLKVADGDPYFVKHHGTYFGVEDSGDFKLSTVGAHDGKSGPDGNEPAQDNTKGSQLFELPLDATYTVNIVDGGGSRENAPADQGIKLTFSKNTFSVELGGETILLQDKDGNTTMKVGDGGVSVAIADHLQSMWTQFITDFAAHTHIDGFGGTGPVNSGPITAYDTNINSSKVTIPDG